ncbi:MAG TPA: CHY zinc finger protein [Microbacterium sp.]|nr:CHY zinc finger protein [Microbacterium sp.]
MITTHTIRGSAIDDESRCVHWHGPNDVLAILFPCCREWYPCHDCHEESAGHLAALWPEGAGAEHAMLCGRCDRTTSIADYRATSTCSHCGGPFNEGCRLHAHLYFA